MCPVIRINRICAYASSRAIWRSGFQQDSHMTPQSLTAFSYIYETIEGSATGELARIVSAGIPLEQRLDDSVREDE